MDRVDRAQRRFPPLGVPIAVVYKFFDDQGNYLAATITYYAFIAIFPLLLLGTSVLNVVLQGNPDLEQQVLDSALSQFPIISTELGVPGGLTGSTTAVVLGSLAAVYGALGLGQAIQNATNVAWSVPRNRRPNPILLRVKSLLLLMLGGLAVLAITTLSILASHTEVLGESISSYQWPILLGTVVVNTLVFTLFFRVAAARRHSLRSAVARGVRRGRPVAGPAVRRYLVRAAGPGQHQRDEPDVRARAGADRHHLHRRDHGRARPRGHGRP